MSGKDYLPANAGKFLEFVRNLLSYLIEHVMQWRIDPSTYQAMERLLQEYEAAYTRAEAPNHGSADILARNESRKALKKEVRQYVKEYLINNRLVTDEDRKRMNLPIHDTKPTPAPVPTDSPIGEVDFSTHQQHKVHVKMGTLTGKTKPEKARGFEVWRKIGGDPPVNDADWSYVNFSSRSPLVIDYPMTDVGKMVYYRFRWLNTRNQHGPWCEGYICAVVG
ncbi:MAG: hypothetical protein LBE13_16480 [Bacteroidales bacterium]|jgi:hypothetical protein|nr:hypothetical protein [Bacteroidales bacterium]